MARKIAYRLEEVRSYRVVRVEFEDSDDLESTSESTRPFKRFVDIDKAHDQIDRLIRKDQKTLKREDIHVTGTVKNWRQYIRNGSPTDPLISRAFSGFSPSADDQIV